VAEDIVTPGQSVALAARAKTELSQTRFAALLGISVRTLHDWEQGRRTPSGPPRPFSPLPWPIPKSCATSPRRNAPAGAAPRPVTLPRRAVMRR